MAARKTTKRPRRNASRKTVPRRPRLRIWLTVLSCCAALVLGAYTLYLDHRVRARFEGARWDLPAHVYASPLTLYPGAPVGRKELTQALGRLGYRAVEKAEGAGSYDVNPESVELVSRPFTFWDGPQSAQAVRILFSDGSVRRIETRRGGARRALVRLDPLLIGSIYPTHGEDRILVRLGDVPPLLPRGLIAVEDRRFHGHHGLDFRAIARALVADIRAGSIVQGGSTITQQLVKNFFLGNQQTLWRKFNEAIMAVLLEIHYGKQDILQAYLNEVYLGQDGSRAVHGFGLGSYFYFRRPLSELAPAQIALLVGLIKGPSYYDPRRHPERALARRNTVLGVFEERGLLTVAQARRASGSPLSVTAIAADSATRYPDFVELVRRQLHGQYRESDLTTAGLRIFTTLDPRVQTISRDRLAQGLERLENEYDLEPGTLQGAVVVTSNEGGDVLAVVGGRNSGYAGFNRALDASRQIGSLIKPAVYLTALREPQRYTLVTPLQDAPIEVRTGTGTPWQPRNYSRQFHGRVPLYGALTHSYNVATVRLGMKLGVPAVIQTLYDLGLRTDPAPLPSLLLGAVNMSPLKVAQLYNTIANDGFYNELTAIVSVTTQTGKPLERFPLELNQTVPPEPIYLLQWAMQRVMREGTGRAAYATIPADRAVAGKTGTTDDLRDSWFAGFGANRTAVVWVGRDDNKPTPLTGSTGALPIWARIMADAGVQGLAVPAPADVTPVAVMVRSGLRADDGCDGAMTVPFIAGSAPDNMAACAQNDAERALDWVKGLFR